MGGTSVGGSEVKVSAWNAGDPGSIPGLGRSPGEGNGNPLQYSCLENPIVKVKVKVKSLSRVRLFATPWTVAHQALPSMGFSRQEYWVAISSRGSS